MCVYEKKMGPHIGAYLHGEDLYRCIHSYHTGTQIIRPYKHIYVCFNAKISEKIKGYSMNKKKIKNNGENQKIQTEKEHKRQEYFNKCYGQFWNNFSL